jgi:hypothetical protein
MRSRGSRGGSGPEYPPSGAVIDYYFAEDQVNEVTLEITDERGRLIRAFSSEPVTRGGVTPGDPLKAEVKLERFGTARIPKTAGMHRFVWDLSSAGSWSPNPVSAGRSGPMVVPGTYFIMFKSANRVQTASFNVLPDPRIEDDGVTQEVFEEQFEICIKIRDLISRARMAEFKIRNALQTASGSNRTNLEGLLAKMVTARGTYQQPMLMAQLSYLNGMLNRADQKPGKDAYDRYEELNEILNGIVAEMRNIPGIR